MALQHAVLVLALAAVAAATGTAAPKDTLPVNDLRANTPVKDWLVVGAFPNPDAVKAQPDGSARVGLGIDYLAAIGGEANPALKPPSRITYADAIGTTVTATVRPASTGTGGVVDLLSVFPGGTNVLAYAVTQVRSKKDESTLAFFGSDDWAKVWVNGELVHSITGPGGRGVVARGDQFPIKLRKGLNTIVAKIEQADGAWGFTLEILPPAEAKAYQARQTRIRQVKRAQAVEIGPEIPWQFIFAPGPFPNVGWKEPERVAAAFGELPLTIRWFDRDLNEVKTAEHPGRYIAYAEGTLPDGRKVRRSATFYCAPAGFDPWADVPQLEMPYLPNAGVERDVWMESAPDLRRFAGGVLLERMVTTEDGPALLAGLSEAKPLGRTPTQLERADMAYQDINLALKMKVLGKQPAALKPPRTKAGAPSTMLHEGTLADADVAADAPQRIRTAAKTWVDDSKVPMTVLVARHGVVVLHEAYGTPERPVDLGARLPLASLTKTHAGLLLAQFIDQGLISLDDPVGKYLPDFPTTGEKVLTVRNCVTHTSGLEGHGEWRGMNNAWLDNVIATGLETLSPGDAYLYNGMGFDLAGKVMEVVSGKSIFRLFHENFFRPLGQENPTIEDLGYGIDCTVRDLARVGQMMLNKGSYGDTEFFSVDTFENQVKPRPLKEFFPNMRGNAEDRYNLGMNYAMDGGAETPILGKNTLTHGSATGAVLRVDYDNDLIVAVCRNTPGPRYDPNLQAFLKAVAGTLSD